MSHNETITPPNSKESEMIVLGCMLTANTSLAIAAEALEENDFYYSEHQLVFSVLKNCFLKDKSADCHIVAEELKRLYKLKTVGGLAYLTSLAQYAGTAANIEEYTELVLEKSMLRKLAHAASSVQKEALNNPNDVDGTLSNAIEIFEAIPRPKTISVFPMSTRLTNLEEKLASFRGEEYLGLCQKKLPTIDNKLLGLRKFILLAAAPNVGKTALTIQMALDVLMNNENACLAYFSLEMPSTDILIRMYCNLSQLDYKTFVLGSGNKNTENFTCFTKDEIKEIIKARNILSAFGDRIQIVDSSQASFLNARKAISFINDLKTRTNSERVIVVVDYLQVWPLDPSLKFISEIEIDKWRVGEIKKIRDALNDDPVIVISEARKPSGGSGWAEDLSAVMGSARVTYSPDGVMLFTQLTPIDVYKLISKDKNDEDVKFIETQLSDKGISICRLDFPKARDGMQRFSIYLKFSYKKNIFEEIPVESLRNYFDLSKKNSSWNNSKKMSINRYHEKEDNINEYSDILPK